MTMTHDTEDRTDAIERLLEIKDEIKELLDEALGLVPDEGMLKDRARAYWYPHIKCALDDEHDILGGSMCHLQNTIDEIENGEEEEG